MNIAIISIGDELALGQVLDTNSQYLSESLSQAGLKVAEHITLGDDKDLIKSHLIRLSEQVDILIVTGGLGPTEDDLTRYSLAEALDVELEVHQDSMDSLLNR